MLRSSSRTIVVRFALLLVIALLGIAVPAGPAVAHDGPAIGDPSVDEPLLPAEAATLVEDQAEALAELPLEADGRCSSTELVEGMGEACRTIDGQFRVVIPGGGSVETHGADAPAAPDAPEGLPHLPGSERALQEASVDDIVCAGSTAEKRIELVYAYPSDRPDRTATIAPLLREEVYKASAYLDAESRTVDPAAGRRLKLQCSGGVPVVNSVAVDPAGTALTGTFAGIISQLVARGYPSVGSGVGQRRIVVYYDMPTASGAAGQGHHYNVDTPGTGSLNNAAGLYAVEYRWSTAAVPHWDTLLHEIGHNMGAVNDPAPDSSGAGHCNDGLDIMCYADGGPTALYTDTECTYERFDCSNDSYFNPAPAGGSYLDTNWNIAATYNQWLVVRDASGEPSVGTDDPGPDSTAPTAPSTPVISDLSTTTFTLDFSPGVDDRGYVEHDAVLLWQPDVGAPVELATIDGFGGTRIPFSGLTADTDYLVRIVAVDLAGNVGPEFEAQVTTLASADVTAPGQPGPLVTSVVDGTVAFMWTSVSDDVGVSGWRARLVRIEAGGGETQVAEQLPDAEIRIATFSGLVSGVGYLVRLEARDFAGNWSTPGEAGASWLAAPGTPTLLVALAGPAPGDLVASWSPPTGGSAAASYEVDLERLSGGLWTPHSSAPTSAATSASFSGLLPSMTYRVQVRAVGAAGARSAWIASTGVTLGAAPDTSPPAIPTISLAATAVTSLTMRWSSSTDAHRFSVRLLDAAGRTVRSVPSTGARSLRFTGLRPARRYTLRAAAIDVAGNASATASLAAATRRDTIRPRTVGWTGGGVVAATRTSLTVRWATTTDNDRVVGYRVYRRQGTAWKLVKAGPRSLRRITITGLPPRTVHAFRVRAVDRSGNVSAWSAQRRGATRR